MESSQAYLKQEPKFDSYSPTLVGFYPLGSFDDNANTPSEFISNRKGTNFDDF